MADVTARPILVTGSNRSGTTWVGQTLCASGELEYLHEPFNPSLWPRLLDAPLVGHYTYVGPENDSAFAPAMGRTLGYRLPLRRHLSEVRDPARAAKLARELVRSTRRRVRRRRPLVKDPIAIFAAEWFADRFDAQVVVMIRHPAGFASSIDRLGADYDFNVLLRQPALMSRYLERFRPEIERFAVDRPGPLEQSVLLWRIFYDTVRQLRERRPEFRYVQYESIAGAPIEGFSELYDWCGIHFDDTARQRVQAWSDARNAVEARPNDWSAAKRNSRAAASTWRTRLSPDQVAAIKEATADVWPYFYDEASW